LENEVIGSPADFTKKICVLFCVQINFEIQ